MRRHPKGQLKEKRAFQTFFTFQMVDLKGDGSMVKFIVEKGTGKVKPELRPVAFLHYRVQLENGSPFGIPYF